MYDAVAAMPREPLKSTLHFGAINFYTEDTNMDEGNDQLANGEPLFIPAEQSVRVRLRWEYADVAGAGWTVGCTLDPDEQGCKTVCEGDFCCRKQMK